MAATNAVLGPTIRLEQAVNTTAGFTHPEYAGAGLTEAKARETHDIVTAVIHFNSTIRTIIDGRKAGFCKLIVDRKTAKILGCHVVGERAVEIAQVAAIAISAGMRVEDLAGLRSRSLPIQGTSRMRLPPRPVNSTWTWAGKRAS